MSWFWTFLIIYFLTDTYLHYKRGMNTFFWSYDTPEEKEIQRKIIERL